MLFVPVECFMGLLFFVMAISVFSLPLWVMAMVTLPIYLLAVVMTCKDSKWFDIVTTNLSWNGHVLGKEVCYVT